MISAIKKNAIPKSLRQLTFWFTTGMGEVEGRPSKRWYSPNTLGELCWDEPSDFSDFDQALQAAEDNVWLSGLSFKIAKPYTGLVIQGGLSDGGRLPKRLRQLTGQIGGYWERRANGKDILGIIKTEGIFAPGFANHRGDLLFMWNDGPCQFTGQPLPDLAGNPDLTNQSMLDAVLEETRRGAPKLRDVMNRVCMRQMDLFR